MRLLLAGRMIRLIFKSELHYTYPDPIHCVTNVCRNAKDSNLNYCPGGIHFIDGDEIVITIQVQVHSEFHQSFILKLK